MGKSGRKRKLTAEHKNDESRNLLYPKLENKALMQLKQTYKTARASSRSKKTMLCYVRFNLINVTLYKQGF